MDRSFRLSPTKRRDTYWLALLLMPVIAAQFTTNELQHQPSPFSARATSAMSMVQHNDDWQLVSRRCEAESGDESVTIWHDVNPADGLIQPAEIVLLEWVAVADALLLSSYYLEYAPQTRLAATEVGASSFATQMRISRHVRSHVVRSDLTQPLSVSVLRGILGARVRELESNSIALTPEAR